MPMLGPFACAAAGGLATVPAATDANRPSQIFLVVLIVYFLPVSSDCLKRAGSRCPVKVTPYSLSVDFCECTESRRGSSRCVSVRHGALPDDRGGGRLGAPRGGRALGACAGF